jgi:wyosine [tRNA(Phe)-imidazoG37] synthetase (radical SAM superfamily)
MLFEGIVFGPIKSRRLGVSLGINLLPPNSKICSFDCLYCECGFNFSSTEKYPSFQDVVVAIEQRLLLMKNNEEHLDVITFAGNGEPTLHPDFEQIIDATITLRDTYFPNVKISVLSNATRISDEAVFRALNRVDNNILKLDSAIDSTLKVINQPIDKHFSVDELVKKMSLFNGNFIIQTLFFKGIYKGVSFDNTTDGEVDAWIAILQKLRPKQVMVYSLDRKTPVEHLERPDNATLYSIAKRVEALGINVSVTE